jgi:hypothetical protein
LNDIDDIIKQIRQSAPGTGLAFEDISDKASFALMMGKNLNQLQKLSDTVIKCAEKSEYGQICDCIGSFYWAFMLVKNSIFLYRNVLPDEEIREYYSAMISIEKEMRRKYKEIGGRW